MGKDKIVIIPGCSDLNRGDQALVWETQRLAEDAGYTGDFYLLSEKNEPVEQSIEHGLKIIHPILEHPSNHFKNKNNIEYSVSLKIKWGLAAIGDFIGSKFVLWNATRGLARLFLSKDKQRTLDVIKDSKAVFMKGGGLLQTYGGLSSTYSMYFWTYPIQLAHALKKPVFVMPNSFGPFEGPGVKGIARKALSNCKVVTTRETISQDMVKRDLDLDLKNYADLAFNLPTADFSKEDIFERFNIPTDRKTVALTMRPYRFPKAEDPAKAYETFKSEMRSFIRWLYKEGYMPVVVEHTLAVNAHENDGACIKDVVSELNEKEYRFVTDTSFDCYDLKRIYSFFDYIVGTRFHSMIFSFGSNVPGIAIAYTGNKSQGIMHDMDLDDYVVEIGDVDAKTLEDKFEELLDNEQSVVEKIKLYRKRAQIEREELVQACKE